MSVQRFAHYKSTPAANCGWACLASIIGNRGKSHGDFFLKDNADISHHGLSLADKITLLTRHEFICTALPPFLNPVNIPGFYLVEGVDLINRQGHTVLLYVPDTEMDIWVMDPKIGQWRDTPPANFSKTEVLLIEDSLTRSLSFEE